MDDRVLLGLYRKMLLIRLAEERLGKLFADGEVPGFLHLSIGQEAVPVGVCSALSDADTVASTHRGHGHALAKGIALDGFFGEIMGRANGVCAGRGGSIHVADMAVGMLGANGIVGGGLPIALGSALAHQVKRSSSIAVAFFGDGAMAEGALHECLNLSALWRLPILFVCENNGWGEFSPLSQQFRATLKGLADAFGIEHALAEGSDVEQVASLAGRWVAAVRSGAGPHVLECATRRWRGHFEGDPQKYRDTTDLTEARGVDPIAVAAARLAELGVSAQKLRECEDAIAQGIDAAVALARESAEPAFELARRDVYAGDRARA